MPTQRYAMAAVCLIAGCSSDISSIPQSAVDPASESANDASVANGTSNEPGGANAPGGGKPEVGNVDNCEEHVAAATLATPDMLVVLDRSGSMNAEGNTDRTDRWSGSRDAVVEVTSSFDDRVRFGLMTFPGFQPGSKGDKNQCTPGSVNVPIALDQGPAIADILTRMNAEGRTPTASSLQAALPVVGPSTAGPDRAPNQKYVLLVTDGDPNCSSPTAGAQGQPDPVARQQTIDAIKALTAQSVKTYVVGYQTAGSDFEDQLDLMAAAGGTGETKHRSVDSGADLSTTFAQIAAGVVSCSYTLDAPVKNASYVLVTVDGKPRALNNTTDGWTLAPDFKTVTLTGAACDAVKGGAVFAVIVKCSIVNVI